MEFNEILNKQIENIVHSKLDEIIGQVQTNVLEAIKASSQLFPNTRYLSPEQTCEYIGKKSKTGLRELLKDRGIESKKFNDRVVRYDRFEIDEKLSIPSTIVAYKKRMGWKTTLNLS